MSAVLAMSTISLSNRIYSVNLLCEQLCQVFCTCENIQTNNNNKQTTNIKRRKEKTKVAFENVHACNWKLLSIQNRITFISLMATGTCYVCIGNYHQPKNWLLQFRTVNKQTRSENKKVRSSFEIFKRNSQKQQQKQTKQNKNKNKKGLCVITVKHVLFNQWMGWQLVLTLLNFHRVTDFARTPKNEALLMKSEFLIH